MDKLCGIGVNVLYAYACCCLGDDGGAYPEPDERHSCCCLGDHGGAHPEPDERHSHDLQHFQLLQHWRTHDVIVREGHQPNDNHVQGVHQPGSDQDLGAAQVRTFNLYGDIYDTVLLSMQYMFREMSCVFSGTGYWKESERVRN